MAEHFLTALLTAANTVSASPIPVHSCLLPTPAAWGSRQRTHCDETFSSKKEKKKDIFSSTSSQSRSFHNHTHICASRAEKTSGQGSSCGCQEYFQKLLVRHVRPGSVRGRRCCCSLGGLCKELLPAESFGQLWLGTGQPLAVPDSAVTTEGG